MNTENLNEEELREIVSDLKEIIDGIKNCDQEEKDKAAERLLNYTYNSDGKVEINIDRFITHKTKKMMTELNLPGKFFNKKDGELSPERKVVDTRVRSTLIRRLDNNFEWEELEDDKKVIHTFLKYVRKSVRSGVRNHFTTNSEEREIDGSSVLHINGISDDVSFEEFVTLVSNQSEESFRDPLIKLIIEQNINTIYKCISKLTEKQEFALRRYIEGYSQKEISEMMGNSQQSVSQIINRARDNLEEKLNKNGIYL